MNSPSLIGCVVGAALSIALHGRRGPAPRSPAVTSRPRRARPLAGPTTRRRAGPIAIVVLTGALGLLTIGSLGVAVCCGSWWTLRRLQPVLRERRRTRAARDALPDTVDLLVLAIRSGLTPHLAVRAMARRAPAGSRTGFVAVVRRLDRGSVLADALPALASDAHPSYAPIVDALVTSERHGTPLALVLDHLAQEARLRRRADAESRARTLPVRMSFPLVVCILPAFVLVAIAPALMAALSSLGSPRW